MQAIAFLKEIEKLETPVLRINDIARIVNKSPEYIRTFIYRLKQKNLLQEIEKSKYALSDEPYEIASNLVFPSYISFLSAYSIYGFTTQIPIVAYIVAAKSKKSLTIENMKVQFIKFKKQNIFAYKRERFRNKFIFIAEPEKAIIDSLYLPDYCPVYESYGALGSNDIKHEKLIEYALKMGSFVAVKRLGYLLELHGVDIYDKVKHMVNKRYDLLNPFMKKSEQSSSKWKLNINEELA